MNSRNKIVTALLGAALLCALILIWSVAGGRERQSTISYSQFLQQVQAGRVAEVKILADNSGADDARVRLKDGTTTNTVLPSHYSAALQAMQQAMVNVEIQDASNSPMRLALNATPFLILLAIRVYFMTTGRTLLGRR
jgi:cell division protease FtsH